MSTLERPALVANPAESYQVNIIACAAITWAIGATFVGLRFYTRGHLLHNVLGAEDWFILVALGFSGATSAGLIEQAIYGLGKHFLDIDLTVMLPMGRAGWYTILWYMMALLFTKISILLLYIRILSYQHARYAAYAIMVIVILTNGLWTFVTVMTACMPLQAFWDFTTPNAWCRPVSYWYANTGLHIATDILLYVLPLPVIINLQIKARQKIFLYSIFALGFVVCSISVVRLWDLVAENQRTDFTFDNVSIAYLTCIEVNAAIACACCMTLKPLLLKLFPRLWGSRSSKPARDVEALAAAGRRPPTIGSEPSRPVQKKRGSWAVAQRRTGSDSNMQLLEDGDLFTIVDEKDRLDYGLESPISIAAVNVKSMPTEPRAAHIENRSRVESRDGSLDSSIMDEKSGSIYHRD
ncbi:hypothetical protein B0T22DRAFT_212693 [Podospora appendiculata]|uniref:Rhodopsin domain-containing protein n=1 Tax=Podospora appendiculata TaxID=314037 RepID=A0AAE0X4Z1_9PEZI|nr:hypothetical protein B0T22DRAFT_212693 [Podospora appendiculata]